MPSVSPAPVSPSARTKPKKDELAPSFVATLAEMTPEQRRRARELLQFYDDAEPEDPHADACDGRARMG